METKTQDDLINEGFLVIEINESRNTILPNSGSHTIRYEDCSSVILFLTSQ